MGDPRARGAVQVTCPDVTRSPGARQVLPKWCVGVPSGVSPWGRLELAIGQGVGAQPSS